MTTEPAQAIQVHAVVHKGGSIVRDRLAATTSHAFVRACSRTATPVTIVTTEATHGRFGQTVSAFSRVSDEPPVVGVCIQRRSPINDVIAHRRGFNVSVLGAGHAPVADSFAGRESADRPPFTFLDDEWRPGENRLPVLAGAAAVFECDLADIRDIGTHHLYLGRVRRAEYADIEPLLHLRGAYRRLASNSREETHR
ncbi:flavin reductase family protein [Prauserella oleivorans]|uniref:Flavin reductase family protein n=1 Tax=Prauserella oleivorans TaxID=1478153 RepID=A0ABW5WE94_9PSEU